MRKKIITKLLILILVTILLINGVLICNTSFAVEAEEVINVVTNVFGGVIAIIYGVKKLLIVIMAFCMSLITTFIGKMDGVIDGSPAIILLTPFHLFFNQLQITDINFFDLSVGANTSTYKIRLAVSSWFYVMRLISSAVLLLILIYVGIRMAITTIAEEKAKYKKMLVDWVCSLALIFILQYVCIFTIYANSAIVNALKSVATHTDISNTMSKIALNAAVGIGINSITSAAVYCFLTIQVLGLLIAYINRMLKVAFLIIISPLISITYSIDKMGDGKSQALDTWLKEYVYTILIQPFHCIIYIGLIGVSFKLLVNDSGGPLSMIVNALGPEYNQLANGVLAILCIKFIKDAEEIVRKIFGFKDDNSTTSMAAGMALTMVAVGKAKSLGKSAREMGSKFGGMKDTLQNALKNDKDVIGAKFNALRNKHPALEKATNTLGGAKEKITSVKDKVKTSTAASKVTNLKNKVNSAKGKIASHKIGKKISGVKKSLGDKYNKFKGTKLGQFLAARNSPASAFGFALGAMAYGSGTRSALEAIGIGVAGQKGAEAYMESSAKTIAEKEEEGSEIVQSALEERDAAEEIEELEEDLDAVETDIEECDKKILSSESEEKIEQEKVETEQELTEAKEKREKLGEPTEENKKEIEKANAEIEEKSKKLEDLNKRKADSEAAKKRKAELEKRRDQIESVLYPNIRDVNVEMEQSGNRYEEGSKEFERMVQELKRVLYNMKQEDKLPALVSILTNAPALQSMQGNNKISTILSKIIDDKPSEEKDEEYEFNERMLFVMSCDMAAYTGEKEMYDANQIALSTGMRTKADKRLDKDRKRRIESERENRSRRRGR